MNQAIIEKKWIAVVVICAVVTGGVLLAQSASADTTRQGGQHKAGCTSERHSVMTEAIEEGDYEAWKSLMDGRGRVTEVVTEENFDTFVEMHTAMESGDTARAQELRAELGLGMRMQNGAGHRGGNGQHRGGGRQGA